MEKISNKTQKILIGLGILGVTSLALGPCSFRVVDSGEKGIKTRFGKIRSEQLDEGLNFKLPIIESIRTFDIRIQKKQEKTALFSSDVQETTVDYALNYQLDPTRVADVYRMYRTKENLEQVLLEPAVLAALKDTMGQYKAEEMIAQREKITAEVLKRLQRDMKEANEPVIIKDITLKDIDFSENFEKAVEEKVVAAQKALTEKNVVEQLKAKKDQQVIAAEAKAAEMTIQANAEAERIGVVAKAEAEAIKLRGEAIEANPKVLLLEINKQWDGKLPQIIGSQSALPLIDALKLSNEHN